MLVLLGALLTLSGLELWPTLYKEWFFSSDEYVYVAEVIRFSGGDFRQRFFDIPGTPFMFLTTAVLAFQHAVAILLDLLAGRHPDNLQDYLHGNVWLPVMFMRVLSFSFYLEPVQELNNRV